VSPVEHVRVVDGQEDIKGNFPDFKLATSSGVAWLLTSIGE